MNKLEMFNLKIYNDRYQYQFIHMWLIVFELRLVHFIKIHDAVQFLTS